MSDEPLDVERIALALRTIHGAQIPLPNRPTPEEYAEIIVRWLPEAREDGLLTVLSRVACQPHNHDGTGACGWDDAIAAVRAALTATPERTPIDVERLATAIHAGERDMDPADRPFCPACLADAERYAAEYTRLSASSLTAPETE